MTNPAERSFDNGAVGQMPPAAGTIPSNITAGLRFSTPEGPMPTPTSSSPEADPSGPIIPESATPPYAHPVDRDAGVVGWRPRGGGETAGDSPVDVPFYDDWDNPAVPPAPTLPEESKGAGKTTESTVFSLSKSVRERLNPEGREAFDLAVDKVARAKQKLESKAGFVPGQDAKKMKAAQQELRELINSAEGADEATRILLSLEALDLVAERQIELSAESVQKKVGRIRAFFGGLDGKKMKALKWGLTGAVVVGGVTVGLLTGGIGAGAGAAILAGATKGAISGGVLGGVFGAWGGAGIAKSHRNDQNTEDATRARVTKEADRIGDKIISNANPEMGAVTADEYHAAAQYMDESMLVGARRRRSANNIYRAKKMGAKAVTGGVVGAARGVVMGGAVGFAAHGIFNGPEVAHAASTTDTSPSATPTGSETTPHPTPTASGSEAASPHPTPTPSGSESAPGTTGGSSANTPSGPESVYNPDVSPTEVNKAQQELIRGLLNDPDKIKEVPGLENFDPQAAAKEAAAQFDGKGKYLWNKLQNAGDLSDTETWRTIVGDGSNHGGLEQLKAQGFDIQMDGDAQMVDGNIKFSGDTWWVKNMQTPDGGVYVTGPKGEVFFYDGSLSQTEQAALLDQLNHGGKIMTPDQLAEQLADKLPDTQEAWETMTKEYTKDMVSDVSKEVNEIDAGAAESNPNVQAAVYTQKEAVLRGYLNDHAETFASFPETTRTQMITQIAQNTGVPAEVIQKMLEDSLELAKS